MRLDVIEKSNCKSTRFPGIDTQCQDKVIAYWCRIVSAVPAARNLVPWNPSTAQRYIHSHDAAFSLVLESRYITVNIKFIELVNYLSKCGVNVAIQPLSVMVVFTPYFSLHLTSTYLASWEKYPPIIRPSAGYLSANKQTCPRQRLVALGRRSSNELLEI